MSDLNFSQLLNNAFENGNVHFKHLEHFLKNLVTKLELSNVSVADKIHSSKNDPMVKSIPSANTLKQGLCREKANPIENMMNVVNLTKRVEALEISVHKLTSLMQAIIQQQKKRNDSDEDDEEEEQVVDPQEEGGTADNAKELKDNKRGFKKCCIKNLSPPSEEGSLPLNQISPIEQLPCLRTLSVCPFHHLEKACKKKLNEIKADDKYANLCDLREFEAHLKGQTDSVISVINSNLFYLSQQICHLQKQMGTTEGHIEDIFFACEQNDEKIDEAILSMNDFNLKIFCLKSDVKGLHADSNNFKKQFFEFNEKIEVMKKAHKKYVDDQLKLFLKIVYEEMEKLVNLQHFNEVIDAIEMRMSVFEEKFNKFHADVKKSMTCLIVGLDDKLNKAELKEFKGLVGMLFDDFIKDLRILFFKVSQNSISAGAFKSFQTDLNCITCDSKVSMTTSFPQLDNSAIGFKNKIFKVNVPKKSSRPGRFCSGATKNLFKTPKIKKHPQSCSEATPQFPLLSQQCFIISKDNTIVKADPLKCFLNSKLNKI